MAKNLLWKLTAQLPRTSRFQYQDVTKFKKNTKNQLMNKNLLMSLAERTTAALHNHYSVNAFICEQNTSFTLFRARKVVTYAHGRDLKIGDKLNIQRAIATEFQDTFVVQVVEIDEFSDFVILEGNDDMHVSSPVLYTPVVKPCTVVLYGAGGLSFQKVVLQGGKVCPAVWKGVSNCKLCGNPEGGGCYEDDSSAIMGICISCKQLPTDSEGSAVYEYVFAMGGAFY